MPASAMAAVTASDVAAICGARPISFGSEGARQADADGEPRPDRRRRRRLAAEHQKMRRQPALGAARHDDGDPPVDLRRRQFEAFSASSSFRLSVA